MENRNETRIAVERTVNCPIAATIDYAIVFFERFENDPGAGEVRLPLRVLGFPAWASLAHRVRLHFSIHSDRSETGRMHEAITFSWFADSRLLPDFHGVASVRIAPCVQTTVTLEGAYRPPLGLLGRFFDYVVGRRLAEATLLALLGRLADELEADHEAFYAGRLVVSETVCRA